MTFTSGLKMTPMTLSDYLPRDMKMLCWIVWDLIQTRGEKYGKN